MTSMAQNSQASQGSLKLCSENLEKFSSSATIPTYDRASIKCGIVHMSVGGFHRSHQALYVDDVLNKGHKDWGICGVGLLPNDKDHIQTLADQNGLYTVLERNADGDKARIIGSMIEVLHAPSNPQTVLDRLMDPDIKILSLTVTEKGYCYNPDGNLDKSNKLIQEDLASPETPKTALGYVVSALARRRKADMPAFTVMSCDNLPGNGHLTEKLVLQFAEAINADLAQWIKENVSFPNAMVDRITPVTTDTIVNIVRDDFGINDGWPVVCEDFKQWVLEDKFVGGRPAFEEVGVQLVEEVDPYEKMKVRLLNGSHSMLSYVSYLMGYRAVDKAMADPLIAKYVRQYMDRDVTPSVPNVPGVNLDQYKDKLIERFANPAISDQVQRLCEDGSAKIPNSILPCIRYQIENGGSFQLAALGLAGWFRYLTGVDEQMKPIEIKDPRAEQLKGRMSIDPKDPSKILGIEEIFGTDLPINPAFVREVRTALETLHEIGTKATLEKYLA